MPAARERELSIAVENAEVEAFALLEAPAPDVRPPHDLRVAARTWLHDASNSEAAGVLGDPRADQLHHTGFQGTRLLADVEGDLGEDHALAARIDAVEVRLWSAFVDRVKSLAGET